ncbi:diacylglycerol kinase [Aequorivita sp. H23M31]|uniref:Diacylglycerol kinase n=1 Tax=Aequorivita ciconiae TaxID=2494375 RepID=A0A451FSG7_9FLAO|nr:diacylglycerol kinase family protein [Aequorivita sp. H23M31]QAA80358.1 diacylglycerol kinase [Aequorivita sp. H23M31]
MKSENVILVVVNPIAGDNDKDNIIELVCSEIKSRNFSLEVYKTTGEGDKAAIDRIINEDNPYRVLVIGGDGTVSLVAQCIHQKEICLGIIPAGSANGMAVNIGLPTEVPQQIDVALSDNIMKMDIIFINNKLCLHIADLGINAELVKNYENSGIRGKLGYFLQSIPTIFNSDYPFEFEIETAQGIEKKTGILLAIANANKFGTGANINPDGKINDGKFEILVFKNLDFIEILKTAQEKPEMSPDFVSVISTDKATIKNKAKVPFQIDGEFMGEIESAEVLIEKESLTIAVPQAYLELHKKEQHL